MIIFAHVCIMASVLAGANRCMSYGMVKYFTVLKV